MMADFWNTYLVCKKAKEKDANDFKIAVEGQRGICKLLFIVSGKHKNSKGKTHSS